MQILQKSLQMKSFVSGALLLLVAILPGARAEESPREAASVEFGTFRLLDKEAVFRTRERAIVFNLQPKPSPPAKGGDSKELIPGLTVYGMVNEAGQHVYFEKEDPAAFLEDMKQKHPEMHWTAWLFKTEDGSLFEVPDDEKEIPAVRITWVSSGSGGEAKTLWRNLSLEDISYIQKAVVPEVK